MTGKTRLCNFCGKPLSMDNEAYMNITVRERDLNKKRTTEGVYRSVKVHKKPCWTNLQVMFNHPDYAVEEEKPYVNT